MCKQNFTLSLLLLVVLLWTNQAFAQQGTLGINQPPSGSLSSEQLLAVAQDIRRLEQQPLASDAKEAHRNLFQWVQGSPDVHVNLCGDVIGPLLESDSKYHAELLAHFILASAAHAIENPEHASNEVTVNVGGIEGALRAYAAMKEQVGDSAKDTYMEKLQKQADKGKLESYVAKRLKKC